MTLFTKPDCTLCEQLKTQFDLAAMQVNVEVLDAENAAPLAHLAWHGLVEAARKTLPILVLDDSSNVADYAVIEKQLLARANAYGVSFLAGSGRKCEDGRCSFDN